VRASTPRRAAALLLDVAILASVVFWARYAYHQAGLYSGAANETLWFYPVAGFFMVLGYQLVFLALMHSTPGMAFLRISVAQVDGRAPTLNQILLRVLVSVPSAAALGLGYLWGIFHPSRQTWHDLAADTIVILGSPISVPRAPSSPPSRPGHTTYRVG
jgi:uncharacterized RDD family membrane protein YckC